MSTLMRVSLYEFYYNTDRKNVGAHRYRYDTSTNTVGERLSDATSSQVENRLTDIIDNLIIVGNVEDGNTYYRTKGGATIQVKHAGTVGTMTVAGGLQIEAQRDVPITQIFDQTKTGNGKVYVLESEVPSSGRKSVYQTLSEHPEYSRFYDLLRGGDPDSAQYNLTTSIIDDRYSCVDFNIRLFDNYHYTIWVPTNESLDAMHAAGQLPYWEDLEAQTDEAWGGDRDAAKKMKYQIRQRILDFLRYHIQDFSVYMGQGIVNGRYETSKLNPENRKFFSLFVDADNHQISVTDALGSDPDAALYWLVRMLDGGCDPLYVARRVVRMASEDIGNADPRALSICTAAWDVQERLGSPEGELALAQAVVYLACAPKSNAVYSAYKQMRALVASGPSYEVPVHLRNAPTKLMKSLDYGAEYRYAHDEPDAYAAGENYFPPELKDTRLYQPVPRGLESKIAEKLTWLRQLDQQSPQQRYPSGDEA